MTASIENWAAQVRSGDVRALSRAVSAIENRAPEAERLLRQLFPNTGHAYRIGITGAPGTGKSTLVDRLAAQYRAEKKTVRDHRRRSVEPIHGRGHFGRSHSHATPCR